MAKKKKNKRRDNHSNRNNKGERRNFLQPLAKEQDGGKDEPANSKTDPKHHEQPLRQLHARHRKNSRTRMEVIFYVVTAAAGIIGILSAVFFSVGNHRDWGLWTSCAAVVLVVVAGFVWFQDRLWKADGEAKTALLIPGNAETPPLPPSPSAADISASDVLLFLGKSVMYIRALPCRLITQDGEDMLLIERDEDNRLFVSLKAFDKNENAYLRITRNEVKTNEKNLFEESKSRHRLTITGTNLKKVFDIEYLNPRAIRLTGDFYIRHGAHCEIQMETLQIGWFQTTGPATVDGAGFDFIGPNISRIRSQFKEPQPSPMPPDASPPSTPDNIGPT